MVKPDEQGLLDAEARVRRLETSLKRLRDDGDEYGVMIASSELVLAKKAVDWVRRGQRALVDTGGSGQKKDTKPGVRTRPH